MSGWLVGYLTALSISGIYSIDVRMEWKLAREIQILAENLTPTTQSTRSSLGSNPGRRGWKPKDKRLKNLHEKDFDETYIHSIYTKLNSWPSKTIPRFHVRTSTGKRQWCHHETPHRFD
jgi:hypothetical protein